MPGSAEAVQHLIHALESGGAAVWIRRALGLALVAGLATFFFLHEFQGLAAPEAMDQAQIGREMLHGRLWKTKVARPLAVGQLKRHGKDVAAKIWTDTYNAPLPPLVDAIALLPVRSHLGVGGAAIYVGDKMIALMSMGLFVGSVVVLFFVARRLFDQRLALFASTMVLIGDIFWRYSLSGLPQMLLLLFFNLTLYALVRAIEAEAEEKRAFRWLGAAGGGFGLFVLTHALTIWIFLAALAFTLVHFRARLRSAVWLVGPVVLLYAPWLLRNYLVCGHPAGIAFYALFGQLGASEAGQMRNLAFNWQSVSAALVRAKINDNLFGQTGEIFRYFGWSVVALGFFPAVLHPFRQAATASTRWLILALWIGAFFGMLLYGIQEELGVAANQLHLLFIPIMTCFGLAFLLVQWNRLEIGGRLARLGFLALLFALCAWPMISNLTLSGAKPTVHWPPYAPPFISVINTWMAPNEIVATDMPAAVAWYADRRAVWLPTSVALYNELNDYNALGGPINGMYLTPVSGSGNTLQDITKGEYKDWAAVILRTIDLKTFALKWGTLLGPDGECVFFSDYDREKASAGK
ncbi:hypothetical protein BH18VER2_BH18VER2_08120 [soil metagenome]